MLAAAWFLRATRWKHRKCTLTGEQIDKTHSNYTVKSTTWVSLRNVTLSGRSQTHTQKGWFQHLKCPGRANCKDRTQIRDGAGVGVTAESACEQAQGKETLRGDAKVWNWLCWRLCNSVSLRKVTRSQVYKERVVLHRNDTAIKLLWVR